MRFILAIFAIGFVNTVAAEQVVGKVSVILASENGEVTVQFIDRKKVVFQANSVGTAILTVIQSAFLSDLPVSIMTNPGGDIKSAAVMK